jgi:hypothetical protein
MSCNSCLHGHNNIYEFECTRCKYTFDLCHGDYSCGCAGFNDKNNIEEEFIKCLNCDYYMKNDNLTEFVRYRKKRVVYLFKEISEILLNDLNLNKEDIDEIKDYLYTKINQN